MYIHIAFPGFLTWFSTWEAPQLLLSRITDKVGLIIETAGFLFGKNRMRNGPDSGDWK
jgi:hypothetical protein